MAVQPNLSLAFLVDSDLVFLDSEEADLSAELLVAVDADVVEMEYVGVGYVFEVGESQGSALDEEFVFVIGYLLAS